MKNRLWLTLGVLVGVALIGAPPASACARKCYCDLLCTHYGDCCRWCGPHDPIAEQPSLKVDSLPGNRVRLEITQFESMVMKGGSCATGFKAIAGIQSIDKVQVVNVADGSILYDFSSNENSAISHENLANEMGYIAANWWAFKADTDKAVPSGLNVRFDIEATLAHGASLFEVVAALHQQGVLGGGSANEDGTLDYRHTFMEDLNSLQLEVKIPATGKGQSREMAGAEKR